MKVLFSCSEAKDTHNSFGALSLDSFSFEDIYFRRLEIINKYQYLVDNQDLPELKKIFGISKEALISQYASVDILNDGTQKAILRYTGVGYKYLDYNSLKTHEQNYIDNNVIIMSNLFGPILAKDKIPFYKLKQGKKIDNIAIDKFYKLHSQDYLDDFFDDELIVDLRASAYSGFYDISDKYHLKIKFVKDGKVISHYSKAYRGLFLKAMSKKEKLRDIHHILHMDMENMQCIDVSDVGKQTLITYEICE